MSMSLQTLTLLALVMPTFATRGRLAGVAEMYGRETGVCFFAISLAFPIRLVETPGDWFVHV